MKIEEMGSVSELSGWEPTEAAQASVVQGKTIAQAVGRQDGTLDIHFEDVSRLTVPCDPDYEAWELSAGDGFLVISQPGGGLGTWSPAKPRPNDQIERTNRP